ncbi:flavo, family protein [Clostridium argentinense CDC 2741]|uniref:Flavo, family protein n=1 Tax=Clostridium argentinense CDC 2741 TaxID=1418104 RepID=A0A0C1QY67_9CLOT|nr:NAD(P)/FAD-dependent oxidoreductase [Clostridium argentinense]ARC83351.1 flavoprotein [Clostridium argentinense]KIE45962.1 flavo, family protein [Clostridium argentinense CDC 2741]NFF39207.1 NAD(P)/FAD-dependent oxidoreductase [Clostridium argentinense]NFP49619.1 NAD(P)/FAD-dependent oxidoreductase [Clostridium argentinense]NFP72322.1 NAD(P)/FAD-dependent oxidoreductase [Clostridium argentinense]
MKHDLIIVGGGASGIMAAIMAKDLGIDVAILESNDRIGKKILTTGNGRCNITNKNINVLRYHSENKTFFNKVFENFTLKNTVEFFNSIGLYLVTLDSDKMYPMSLQASSVLDVFRFALEEREVPIYLNHKVKEINYKNKFIIDCVNEENFICSKLLLCTGGKSAPKTGSDGSGFTLARKLGHSIINPIPALVQLKLNHNKLKALSGVKFDGNTHIYVNDKLRRSEFGEVLFTDYGISGPPILQLSRIASYNLSKGKDISLKIDMMSNFSKDELKDFLENHFGTYSYRSVHDALIGIINKKIIPIILKEANIDNIHKPCWSLEWEEKEMLLSLLKEWTFKVSGTNSFDNAQVTAGGVDTKEVDENTLQSKIVPNLYFAGEILDVDGDCGGFNLQWAWSSASVAIKSLKMSEHHNNK